MAGCGGKGREATERRRPRYVEWKVQGQPDTNYTKADMVDELDDESEDGAFIPAHVRIITISAAAATGVLEDDPTPVTDA